ncbi:hypothetical protein [Alkalihalobacillus sp. BA299]|uniref:hypothetical protein n=1 Tax=Alkalihalobacillus sp. BA299 TaxID=2815938 RepID=UPI001ADA43BE|nr:hypothetical protein [Alkalihalobacillus sp. BA299]
MEMMKIPLSKITPAFEIKKCKSEVNTIKQNMNFKSVLFIPLFVEKQPNGKYLLIGSYQDYFAFKETFSETAENVLLPCITINTSISRKERLLIILRYLLQYSRLDPLDKHVLFVQLRKHIPLEVIAKETGYPCREVLNYLFHPNIPLKFRRLDYSKRLLILNKIETLDLDPDLKEKLYHLAVLQDDHPKRLTFDKLRCFSRFLQTFKEQISRISKVDKETLLIKIIESDIYIDRYLESLLKETVSRQGIQLKYSFLENEINPIPFSVKNRPKHVLLKLNKKILITV